MLHVADHAISALLLVVLPIYVALRGRRNIRQLAEHPEELFKDYWITISMQWTSCAVILGTWQAMARPLHDLGLGLEVGTGFIVGVALVLIASVLMLLQQNRLRTDPAFVDRLRPQLAEMQAFVPRTSREIRTAHFLCVTAGICEEIAYRGFILWYLSAWISMPWAIAVMAIAFGAVHLYQGVKPAAQIILVATSFALLYVLTGSLWLPIVLHVILDVNQFSLARFVLRQI